jgi:hypothetical protein
MPLHDPNILSDVAAEISLTVMKSSNWVRRFHIKNKRTRIAEDLSTSTFLGEIRSKTGVLVTSFTFTTVAGTPSIYFDVSLTIANINLLIPGTEYYFDWFRIVGSIPKKIAKGTIKSEANQTVIP